MDRKVTGLRVRLRGAVGVKTDFKGVAGSERLQGVIRVSRFFGLLILPPIMGIQHSEHCREFVSMLIL